jgi:hypothetical protein
MIDSDPQLAVGLMVVRAKLACRGENLVFSDYFVRPDDADAGSEGSDSKESVADSADK